MNLHEKHRPRFTVAQRRNFLKWGVIGAVGIALAVWGLRR